jgi:hypothetical protein
LDTYYQHLSFTIPYAFLISCDEDDESMNNPHVIQRLKNYPNLHYRFSNNTSKVEAYNKDIDTFDFEILIAASDDMIATQPNFDVTILWLMNKRFPDLDGVINSFDGTVGRQCNTIPIIGRTFYNRFGYIYNPAYKAMVCNLELTNVSKMLRKEIVVEQMLFKHCHPAWGLAPLDDLYRKNESYHTEDKKIFQERQLHNFGLTQEHINQTIEKIWSILICTIEGREESFDKLCKKLKQQTATLGLDNQIEILSCKDKRGENSVGYKRNALLAESAGKYISYIDDDDDIHDNFIELIYNRLLKNPDCVSLVGIITFNGAHPKKFIHSLEYSEYSEDNEAYYRPPNHLNPIRRSLAVQFTFPEKNIGEDTDWAMSIARSGLLRSQEVIEEPYYFYLYNDAKDSPKYDAAETKALNMFAQLAYSTIPTLHNTYDLATTCIRDAVPGDFVECGVAAGSQIATMAYACQRLNSAKKVHLFDSFEGIPLAGIHDKEQPGIGAITHNVHVADLNDLLISSGITAYSLENVKDNLRRWEMEEDRFLFHKGWFQHTLPSCAHEIEKISLLRLDGDLYESTKVCLEYLYPKVSVGGYVIIDDFALAGCKKAVSEYLAQHNINPTIIEISGGNGPVYWKVE